MPENELLYLRTRQRQSAELAEESGDVSVRMVHQKMAGQYAERIASLSQKPAL